MDFQRTTVTVCSYKPVALGLAKLRDLRGLALHCFHLPAVQKQAAFTSHLTGWRPYTDILDFRKPASFSAEAKQRLVRALSLTPKCSPPVLPCLGGAWRRGVLGRSLGKSGWTHSKGLTVLTSWEWAEGWVELEEK